MRELPTKTAKLLRAYLTRKKIEYNGTIVECSDNNKECAGSRVFEPFDNQVNNLCVGICLNLSLVFLNHSVLFLFSTVTDYDNELQNKEK